MGGYSLKIRSIHPLGVNGANLACKQNRKMVKSANLFFAHWAFPSGYAIMLMLIALCAGERRLLTMALLSFRNKLVASGKPTEDINELLIRLLR